jgi:PEGA domain
MEKNMNLIIWLVALFLSFSVYAEEQGGLAIVTVPADAEIYVNGVLKANSSPAYLILSEGKYQVEVRKIGKKTETLEIIIGKDTVVKKEVVLSDMPSEQSKLSLTAMLNPVRDSFETDDEFQQRRENLLKQFNEAVQRHETAFQAGVATLDKEKYNINTGTFLM